MRPLPASFFKRPEAKCPHDLVGCKCGKEENCKCRFTRRESELCEKQLMPWMLQYNRQAPSHQRLPFEIWSMILDNVRDRPKLASRARALVRTSRFSPYSDFLDLARLYAVVAELDYFFEHR